MSVEPFCGRLHISSAAFAGRPDPAQYHGFHILFHGFIANATAITKQALGKEFALSQLPASNAELLALAYRMWSEQLGLHVLGEFSLAIHDPSRNRLVLCADSLGLYPLFYFVDREHIVFAQYMDDLLPFLHTNNLDEEYLADFLVTGAHSGPRTPFANVCRLMPGEVLSWERGVLARSRPWDWRRIEPVPSISFEDAASALLALLQQAVESCLPAHGKVWCELSGGLDSSTIAVLAHKQRKGDLEALTMVYPQTEQADESGWVGELLHNYPMPWHCIDADSLPPFSALPNRFLPEPGEALLIDGLLHSYRQMAAANDVSVILSGEGGDAVFVGEGAEPFYWADNLLNGCLLKLWRDSQAWTSSSPVRRSRAYWLRRYAVEPAWRYCRKQPAFALESSDLPDWLELGYVKARKLHERRQNPANIPRMRPGSQFQASCVAGSAQAVRAGYRCQKEAFQFRFPLLYRPLVEFMFAVPWELKLQPDANRLLQRRALRNILPEKIRTRKGKRGPSQAYFEGLRRNRVWVDLLTKQPRLVARGYVAQSIWKETVQKARFGVAPSLRDFLSSAVLEAWLQQLETQRDNFAPWNAPASVHSLRPAQASR